MEKGHERFKQHAKSVSHREAMMKISLMNSPTIDAQLSCQVKQTQNLHFKLFLIVLSSLKFLLIAVRGHDEIEGNLMQLLLLRCEDNSKLKVWIKERKYLSSDIINEIMQIMSNYILRQLLVSIREASMYSLIVDEATDISKKEQLCMCIRWVDKDFEIHEDPVELTNVPKTDAKTLSAVIKDSLIRFALPISQCRGQAYDGASNMSGHINGVAAKIQEAEPTALYVHCLAHCTNLCLQSIGKKIPVIWEALNLTMELSDFIKYSPKRAKHCKVILHLVLQI